jgi:hypothetical protein
MFKGLTNQISTFCICADGFFRFFEDMLMEKLKSKFFLASNLENQFSNPLQSPCSAELTLRMHTESRLWS